MRTVLAVLSVLVALAGCAPEYNWREIRSPDDGWSAMLPGKPAKMTRRIHLEALEVPMTMQGAKVGDTTFTVAAAELPHDSDAGRTQALAAMRAGMLRNLGARETAARDVAVTVVDAGGAALGRHPAVRVEAEGTAQGRPATMSAGFAAKGSRAWQWVVIGPDVDREQATVFLDSFRIVGVAQ